MDRDARTIARYLTRHAEPVGTNAWPFDGHTFDHVVVVPAYAEDADFIDPFWQHATDRSVLLIIVVNAPDRAPAEALRHTEALLRTDWSQRARRCGTDSGDAWLDADARRGLWLIDQLGAAQTRSAPSGVGHARKLGMDLALRAICEARVRGSWIWCCDADGQWPPNYFDLDVAADLSAVTFAFEHTGPLASAPAQRVYDLRLRDYPVQLAKAGSRYAFQALGSAMAVSANHYAQVRGCPKRAAGEDFHLLAKLAKVGAMKHRADITVRLRARLSTRVPFGTGPGVARLAGHDDPWDAPFFYSDQSLTVLRRLLDCLEDVARIPLSRERFRDHLNHRVCGANAAYAIDELIDVNEWREAVQRAVDASPLNPRRQQHLEVWFDALRTLRLLHHLRDAGMASVSARDLARSNPQRLVAAGARPTELESLK
ncbi:MAG: hypothetical protein AB8G17_21780 [Gammaproteobacteria bacterium]